MPTLFDTSEHKPPASLHPFEAAGLGVTPFEFVAIHDTGRCSTTCDYCGTGIRYICEIASGDGGRFKVGTDCVRKTDQGDNRVLAPMERELAKLEHARRLAKREADRKAREEKRRAAMIAREQAEREANGGLTNEEKAEADRRAEEARLRAQHEACNRWLIVILREGWGDFCSDMARKLETQSVASLSPRAVDILRDIYAKHHGRRGSKAYQAAEVDFDSRVFPND